MAKDCCWNCKFYVINKPLDYDIPMLDGPGPNYCSNRDRELYANECKGKIIIRKDTVYSKDDQKYIYTKPSDYCDKYQDRFH